MTSGDTEITAASGEAIRILEPIDRRLHIECHLSKTNRNCANGQALSCIPLLLEGRSLSNNRCNVFVCLPQLYVSVQQWAVASLVLP
jgi:hypothetical protein